MRGGAHDVGGSTEGSVLSLPEDRAMEHWEVRTHALAVLMIGSKLITVDSLRRGVEALPREKYEAYSYYERWVASMTSISVERGLISAAELDRELSGDNNESFSNDVPVAVLHAKGSYVKVRSEVDPVLWRRPHLRTPGYVHGAVGVVERVVGIFSDPSRLAFDQNDAAVQPLYRVRFVRDAIWPVLPSSLDKKANGGSSATAINDTVDVEIYQPWLVGSRCSRNNPYLSSWS